MKRILHIKGMPKWHSVIPVLENFINNCILSLIHYLWIHSFSKLFHTLQDFCFVWSLKNCQSIRVRLEYLFRKNTPVKRFGCSLEGVPRFARLSVGQQTRRRIRRSGLRLGQRSQRKWPGPRGQLINPRVGKCPANSWSSKRPGKAPPLPAGWQNLIATGPGPLPSEKSVLTRNPPIFWFGSCLSRGWWGRSPRISKPTWSSRVPPSVRCRRLAKRTWWVCLKILICSRSIWSFTITPQRHPVGSLDRGGGRRGAFSENSFYGVL